MQRENRLKTNGKRMFKKHSKPMCAVMGIVAVFLCVGGFNIDFSSIEFLNGFSTSLITGTSIFTATMPFIWIKDNLFVKLTPEQVKELSPDEMIKYSNDLQKNLEEKESKINMKLKLLSKDSEDNKEEISKLKSELGQINAETFKELLVAVQIQGKELAKLKDNGSTASNGNSLAKAIKEKAEALKTVKDKAVQIVIKAKQDPTDIGNRSELGQWLTGVEQLARRSVFMKDLFTVLPATTEYIKKMEQDVVVRDAKTSIACAVSTHNTKLTWKRTDLQMKKVRDFVDICIDMMEDYTFVTSETTDLIDYGVASKVDEQLLLGDGAGANLNGVDSYASTFSAALAGADYSALVQEPTVADLISVMGAQIEFLGANGKFMPNVAILNPKQIKLLKLAKDANNLPLSCSCMVMDNGTFLVDGIVLVGNPLVPENELYVMDTTKGTIYERRGSNVEFAYENKDNFEHECVTAKAYERINLWVASNNQNAFMKCSDIAVAIAAIKKP